MIGFVGCFAARPKHRTHKASWRTAVCLATSIFIGANHGIIAILFVKGSPSGTGTGIYFLIMLSAWILSAAEVNYLDE